MRCGKRKKSGVRRRRHRRRGSNAGHGVGRQAAPQTLRATVSGLPHHVSQQRATVQVVGSGRECRWHTLVPPSRDRCCLRYLRMSTHYSSGDLRKRLKVQGISLNTDGRWAWRARVGASARGSGGLDTSPPAWRSGHRAGSARWGRV